MHDGPDHCPNESCPARAEVSRDVAWFWRKGTFVRRDQRVVKRYQCRACKRHFSDRTLRLDYKLVRLDINGRLVDLLKGGASIRSSARLLGVSRKTAQRRMRLLMRPTRGTRA
jgi:transposase-like protein